MSGKGLAVQGGLALAGLLIAYSTWQRDPDRAEGEVVVVDSTKAELASVHFEDETNIVDIRRRDNNGESGVWLRVEDKTPAPPAPPKAGQPAPVVPKPHPPRELRGEEAAEKFLAQFAPFHSPRAFGVLDASKTKELGLADTKKKLIVTARGEKHEFAVGQPLSLSTESYLRDTKDGRVYLLSRSLLNDLQSASHRLVDRRLHSFKIADFGRITVKASGKSRDLVVTNGHDQATYKLAPAGTPDKPDELARNWHEKIWRLFPTELMGQGETPASGEPKVVAHIDYLDGNRKVVGWLDLAKIDVAGGAESAMSPAATAPANRLEIYGRSEHTAGWVRLPNDPSVLQDAEKVAGGS